jgi:hypothetical protein
MKGTQPGSYLLADRQVQAETQLNQRADVLLQALVAAGGGICWLAAVGGYGGINLPAGAERRG